LLLRDLEPYGIISVIVCVTAVAMVMLLRDFGPYGIIFMTMTIHPWAYYVHVLLYNATVIVTSIEDHI
jgi:hypothetical protein